MIFIRLFVPPTTKHHDHASGGARERHRVRRAAARAAAAVGPAEADSPEEATAIAAKSFKRCHKRF
jgi:hypothetical protein